MFRDAYVPGMPDLWFPIGLAVGIVLTGFVTFGSFDRGAASVRRELVSVELSARQRAVMARRSSAERSAAEYAPERLRA